MSIYSTPELRGISHKAKAEDEWTYLIIIYPLFSRIHVYQGIPHDIVNKWASVYLSKDEAE